MNRFGDLPLVRPKERRGRLLLTGAARARARNGAVNPSAPHYDAGHCNDNGNDLLCKSASTIPYDPSLGGFYVDYGNDDYWDPAADPFANSSGTLSWWTINRSRLVCPSAAGTFDPDTGAPFADCTLPNANPGY